jgi:hypothetical protein
MHEFLQDLEFHTDAWEIGYQRLRVFQRHCEEWAQDDSRWHLLVSQSSPTERRRFIRELRDHQASSVAWKQRLFALARDLELLPQIERGILQLCLGGMVRSRILGPSL